MITFTKEQLIASAHARIEFAEMMLAGELEPLKERTWSIELELARIALASLEAEPVSFDALRDAVAEVSGAPVMEWSDIYKGHQAVPFINFNSLARIVDKFRAAPPAPVAVPDELSREEYKRRFMEEDDFDGTFRGGWNACRAAMLQGAEPVTKAYKLPEGFVAVPVEPTEDMIVNGFESEPDESFSDTEVWEAYEAMSGCQQAAHRAKLCWAAMIAAAPKTEHK